MLSKGKRKLTYLIIVLFFIGSGNFLPTNVPTRKGDQGQREPTLDTKGKGSNKQPVMQHGISHSPFFFDPGSAAYNLRLHGNALFVGNLIVNISDPMDPSVLYGSGSGSSLCCIEGDRAYYGPTVFDITNLSAPSLMDSITITDFQLRGVAVSGNYAYLTGFIDANSYFYTINVTDPWNIENLGSIATSDNPEGIWVKGDYAYLANGYAGLAIIDITNPLAPNIVHTENTQGYAQRVWVDGNIAYVADDNGGLAIINVEDPTNPQVLTQYSLPGDVADVWVEGDLVFVVHTDQDGFSIINVTNPATPDGYITIPLDLEITLGIPSICVSGEFVFVSAGTNGIAILNISSGFNIGTPSFVDTANKPGRLSVEGDHTFIIEQYTGFISIDTTNPLQPGTPDIVGLLGAFEDLDIHGDFAYTACGDRGVGILDISDPDSPSVLKFYNMYMTGIGNESIAVEVVGDLLFIGLNGSGMAIANISDPLNPSLVSHIVGVINVPVNDIEISGDLLFAASDTMIVINITDVRSPAMNSTMRSIDLDGNWANEVFLAGDRAYVAAGSKLWIVNITKVIDPSLTPRIKSLNLDGDCNGVWVEGDYAFIANGSIAYGGSLVIVNISDWQAPNIVKSVGGFSQASSVQVAGNYAFVAAAESGFVVIPLNWFDFRPWDLAISINDGSPETTQRAVTTSITVSNATEMSFSNDSTTWTAWEPFSSTKSLYLPAGAGVKTVYGRMKNGFGVSEISTDTITALGPSNLGISVKTNTMTNDTGLVEVTLAGTNVVDFCLSNDSISWTTWTPFTTTTTLSLPRGGGIATIYYKARNDVEESAPVTDTVWTALPSNPVVKVNETTTNPTEYVSVAADNATWMQFSMDGITYSARKTFAPTIEVGLTEGPGNYTVHVILGNYFGELAPVTAQIELLPNTTDITTVIIIAVASIGGVVGVVAAIFIRSRRARAKVAGEIDSLMDEFQEWEKTGEGKKIG